MYHNRIPSIFLNGLKESVRLPNENVPLVTTQIPAQFLDQLEAKLKQQGSQNGNQGQSTEGNRDTAC